MRMILLPSLSLLLLLVTNVLGETKTSNPSSCVLKFSSDRNNFQVCKTHLCFLFKEERPYVFPSKKLAAEPSHPFLCRARERLYPGLDGVFFDVLNRLAFREEEDAKLSVRDAYCIYIGSECSFDGLVSFLDDAVRVGEGHLFIAGGYLVFMGNRRTVNNVQSARIITEKISLMHRRNPNTHSFRAAVNSVFKPFEVGAWLTGFGFTAILGIVLAIFVRLFFHMRAYNEPNMFTWVLNGVHGVNPEQRAAWRLLVTSFFVLGTILILLYEVAIALAIFQGPEPRVTSLSQLESLGLSKFGVAKEAASETIFRLIVDQQGELNDSNIPWNRLSSLGAIIRALLSKKIDFVFCFEQSVKFQLHKLQLCDKVSVTPLNLGTGGGWFYSTNVPVQVRTRIDKILEDLWISQEIMKGISRFGEVPVDCALTRTSVDHNVLIILLGLTVGPLLLLAIGFMVKANYFPVSTTTNEIDLVMPVQYDAYT